MAGVINPANVVIGYDPSKLKAGLDASRVQLNMLKRDLDAGRPSADKLGERISVLNIAFEKGAINAKQYADTLKMLKSQMDSTGQGGGSSGGGVTGMGSLKGLLTGYAIFGAVKSMMQLTSQVEQATVAFEVLIGSGKKAVEMIADMKQLDAISSLNFVDITQGGKILLGYGVAYQKVMPILRQLGDVSMGNNDKFRSLALAFGQVTAAGRLMGQETLQMVNAGFNPLQQISYSTGKSMVELKKDMEDGKISIEMVMKALEEGTSAGGRFHQMNQRMADTGLGAWNKMVSAIQMASIEIGNELVPAMKEFADLVTTVAKSPVKDAAVAGVSTWVTGMSAIVDLIGSMGREGDNPFEWLDQNARDIAARKVDALIAERDFNIKEAARKKQDELNAIAAKLQAEKELGDEAMKPFEAARHKAEDEIEKRRMGEHNFQLWKLRQELNTTGLSHAERMRVEKEYREAARTLKQQFDAEEAAEAEKVNARKLDGERKEAERTKADIQRLKDHLDPQEKLASKFKEIKELEDAAPKNKKEEREKRNIDKMLAHNRDLEAQKQADIKLTEEILAEKNLSKKDRSIFEDMRDREQLRLEEIQNANKELEAKRPKSLFDKAREQAAKEAAEHELGNKKFGAVSAQQGSVEAYKLLVGQENDKKRRDAIAQKTRENIEKALIEMNKRKPVVLAKAGA